MYASEPPEKFEVFKHLKFLIGEWDMEVLMFQQGSTNKIRGQVSFLWLEPGPFVVQHAEFPNSEFPTSISLIGYDETSKEYAILYSDSSNVSRVYKMLIDKENWTVLRRGLSESARFTGVFANEGKTITGKWENATDGANWEESFKVVLTRKQHS